LGYLVFRARDGDKITGLFGVGEVNFTIPLFFELLDLGKTSDEFAMVQSVDDDGFGDKFGVLR